MHQILLLFLKEAMHVSLMLMGMNFILAKKPGMLTCSDAMFRLITLFMPYIGGDVERNPTGLPKTGRGNLIKGRDVLKPAGKAM